MNKDNTVDKKQQSQNLSTESTITQEENINQQHTEESGNNTEQKKCITAKFGEQPIYVKGAFILNILLFIATATLAVFSYLQWRAMSKQMTISMRAWVNINSVELENTINSREPPVAFVTSINTGNTPAMNCKITNHIQFSDTEEKLSSPELTTTANAFTVASGAEYSSTMPFKTPHEKITDEDINLLIQQKLKMYITGIIHYEDVFGHAHTTKFCVFNTSFDSLAFRPCSRYNTMD